MNTRRNTRRARWAGAVAMGAVGIVLLSACNPISQEPQIPGVDFATTKLIYDGPADAWIEVGVSGIGGYQVQTETAVWVPNPGNPPVPRACTSATDRTAVVTCNMGYAEFPHTDHHQADLDPAGTYWPTILVHPGEHFEVHTYCTPRGDGRACPPGLKVEARSVDDAGKLIGDLHGPK
jgi:hypothetical protein